MLFGPKPLDPILRKTLERWAELTIEERTEFLRRNAEELARSDWPEDLFVPDVPPLCVELRKCDDRR